VTTPPRILPVAGDSTDPALAAVFDVFRADGRDVPLLYRTLGTAPAMLQAWTAMAWPLRHDAQAPRGLRELLIMRVAQLTAAPFEWISHWDMAVKHGVDEQQLAELHDWTASERFADVERAALAMCDELTRDLHVADGTWDALAAHFGQGELVELVLTVSFYSCVSRTLHAIGLGAVDATDPAVAGRLSALSGGDRPGVGGGSSSAPSA
jgi:AhpD family alkylhydroperoxidase